MNHFYKNKIIYSKLKKPLKFFVALMVIIPCLSSCSDELSTKSQTSDDKVGEYELPGYIRISLNNASIITRDNPTVGDGFQDGLAQEYALATSTASEPYHYIWLYNANFGGTAVINLDVRSRLTNSDNNITLSIKNIFTNKQIANSIKSKSNFEDFLRNAKIYVLLNFDKTLLSEEDESKSTKEILLSKTDISEIKVSKYKIRVSNTDYYTMTSAVYLDGNEMKIASIVPGPGTEFIYYTEEEANSTSAVAAITAYVDRLAAKVQFTDNAASPAMITKNQVIPNNGVKVKLFNKLDETYSYDYSLKTWSATVLGYGLNALEPSQYLIKHLKNDQYFKDLSQPSVYRTYWALDPHYEIKGKIGDKNIIDNYPQQYRPALENSEIRYHSGGYTVKNDGTIESFPVNTEHFLKYVSLKDIIDGSAGILYSLENTYDDSDDDVNMGNKGYFSASTHLLLACQLKIDGVTSSNIYRDQNDIFYTSKTQVIGTKLSIMQNKYLPGGNSGLRVFYVNWKEHDRFGADLVTVSWNPGDRLLVKKSGSTQIEEIKEEDLTLIPAELKGGDGKMLIAPLDPEAKYYIGNLDKTGEAIELGYNRFVSLFYELLGAIDYYKNGYMYYATPFPNKVSALTSDSWKTPGHIGLVRNNWYMMKVSKVTAPGTPVAEVAQPIIPMLDDKRSYIAVEAQILNWHEIGVPDYPFSPDNSDNGVIGDEVEENH